LSIERKRTEKPSVSHQDEKPGERSIQWSETKKTLGESPKGKRNPPGRRNQDCKTERTLQ